jgi:hypothetical protein
MPRSSLLGRRVHIAGSIATDLAVALTAEVESARALVQGLVQELVRRGANFVLPAMSRSTVPAMASRSASTG